MRAVIMIALIMMFAAMTLDIDRAAVILLAAIAGERLVLAMRRNAVGEPA